MSFNNPHFNFQPQQPESSGVEVKPVYFDDNDSTAILDTSVLDEDMQASDNLHYRKASFANGSVVMSPVEPHTWTSQYSASMATEPSSIVAGGLDPHAFHKERHAFVRSDSQQFHPSSSTATSVFAPSPQAPAWAYEPGAVNCDPSAVEFGPAPNAYETPQFGQPPPPQHHHRSDSAHTTFSHPSSNQLTPAVPGFRGAATDGNFMPAQRIPAPMSPHSHQDWMAMAQQEAERRPVSKRMRPASPPYNALDSQRRDGVRKRNGRIDIPHERNIHTIEDMIESTHDEELLKELKQQKRLLRNREAALASRQRKKKHTEDLETREKEFGRNIAHYRDRCGLLESQLQSQTEAYKSVVFSYQEAQRRLEMMQEEKREMTMNHNEETSQLRKRLQLITDQFQHDQAPLMSAASSSSGYSDFNAEMEALTVGPHEWDSFIRFGDLQNDPNDDFDFDARSSQAATATPVLGKKPSSSTIVPGTPKKHTETPSDQPVASGLLFFLLLCGAFVASKPAMSRPADLPHVPPAVRAAAPTVLNNLLSEAGPPPNVPNVPASTSEPSPSTAAISELEQRPNPDGTRLDQMHQRLTSATKQQEIDSAFSLTRSQYASIANMDDATADDGQAKLPSSSDQSKQLPAPSTSSPRRNLAEALADMQQEHARNSKAEVYTRSLLWEQIPPDVVRQFKEMVRDQNEIEVGVSEMEGKDENRKIEL